MRAGRWLQPDDTYAMVLNQKVAQKLGVGVGDWVTLDISLKRESHWKIVGLLFEILNEEAVHVPRKTLLAETRQVGRAGILRLQTAEKDALAEKSVAQDLRNFYESRGLSVRTLNWETAHELTHFALNSGANILINLLAGMAVIIAIVGGSRLKWGTLHQRAGASPGDWGHAGHWRLISPNFQIDRRRRITARLVELACSLTPKPASRVDISSGSIVANGRRIGLRRFTCGDVILAGYCYSIGCSGQYSACMGCHPYHCP
jgi:hypothetical protein